MPCCPLLSSELPSVPSFACRGRQWHGPQGGSASGERERGESTGEPVQPLPSMSSPPVVLRQPKEVGLFLISQKRLRHLDPVIPPDFPSALPFVFPPFSSPLLLMVQVQFDSGLLTPAI